MTEQEKYWIDREEKQRALDKKNEGALQKRIDKVYQNALNEMQAQLNAWYAKYADNHGMTMKQAKQAADSADIAALAAKAAEYVKNKDFSDQANEEMALYNLAMKANRLDLLMAQMGCEMTNATAKAEKIIQNALEGRGQEEIRRQAGILGDTVFTPVNIKVDEIAAASFHSVKWSDRIWANQADLRKQIKSYMSTWIVRGIPTNDALKSLRVDLQSTVKNAAYCARRIVVTERQRVAAQVQMEVYKEAEIEWFRFVAEPGCCPVCAKLEGQVFKVSEAQSGKNMRPMHPNCRCNTVMTNAPSSETKDPFDEWMETFGDHEQNYSEWLADHYPELAKAKKKASKPTVSAEDKAAAAAAKKEAKQTAALQKKLDDANIKLAAFDDSPWEKISPKYGAVKPSAFEGDVAADITKNLTALKKKLNYQKKYGYYNSMAITQKEIDKIESFKLTAKNYQKLLKAAQKAQNNLQNKTGILQALSAPNQSRAEALAAAAKEAQKKALEAAKKAQAEAEKAKKAAQEAWDRAHAGLKKISVSGTGVKGQPLADGIDLGADAYSQARKDAAHYSSKKQVDKLFRPVAGQAWKAATQQERRAAYDYTGSYYTQMNRPLAGFEGSWSNFKGVGKVDIDYERNGGRTRSLTRYIERNVSTVDTWLARGTDYGQLATMLGIDYYEARNSSVQELQKFVGTSNRFYPFTSTGSLPGSGFGGDVILKIYAPAGTEMAYVEPISNFGNGDGLNWDGDRQQSSFGGEFETILQRGIAFDIVGIRKKGRNGVEVELELHPERGYDKFDR